MPTPKKGGRPTRATAATKKAEALEMMRLRASGVSVEQIATKYGIAARTVYQRINTTIDSSLRLEAEKLRVLELHTLDMLQRAAISAALKGDTPSIHAVLKIMEARAKYLRLHETTITADSIESTAASIRSIIEAP